MVPCIWAQMVPLQSCIHVYWIRTQRILSYSGTDGPVAFGHRWSHCIRTYKFLLDPGTDGPFRNQAQMILVHLGTDGPIAFVHTSSYGNHTQTAPCLVGHRWALFRHRWSCCIWAQMVPLHSYIQVPIGSGHRWSLP